MHLDQIIIEGRGFRDKKIDSEFLVKNSLQPKREVRISNTLVGISSPYYSSLRKGKAFVVYIQQNSTTYARTFFLSSSQGLYRVLKAYKFYIKDNLEYPKWHDKGYSEESITLPAEIQKTISELAELNPIYEEHNGEIFYGLVEESSDNNQFEKVVDSIPFSLNEDLIFSKKNKIAPEKLVVKESKNLPDFSYIIEKWKAPNRLISNVYIYTFCSRDKNLKYSFATDHKLFSWIASIELTSSPLTKFGVFQKWVQAGDFNTPPFEYLTQTKEKNIDQTGGYGNETIRNGHYVDMYQNYLSKIKMIQDFNDSMGLSLRLG